MGASQRQTPVKRAFYVCAFTCLGILLQFLAHALLEMAAISLFLRDFDRYGLGLSWEQWYAVHHALSAFLLALGIVFGYRYGVFWWRVLYIEHREGNLEWRKKFRPMNT